ncbi:MAG: NAD-dependent epimerase/dehydratase family protein [Chloroflexota bacterium]
MKILVTGGIGAVGKPVVARLVQSGHAVRVFDRQPGAALPGAEYLAGDVTDFAAVREAVRGQEAIVHLAAIPHPGGTPGSEIFRVNGSGTFNVYEAAAQEGIRRIATASSINWLGYYYGCKDFPIQYLPIDEQHPNFTSEPYSFSKQVTEDIAAYYWRREGISSTCLRMPGVITPRAEWLPEFKQWWPKMVAMYEEWFGLPDAAQQERLTRVLQTTESWRAQRMLELPYEEQEKRGVELSNPDVNLAFSRSNLWVLLDGRDAAQAFEKSLLAEFEGCYPLFVNDSVNTAGVEAEALARTFFPGAGRSRPLAGKEALVSIERARRLIGFEPEYSFARWAEA